MDQGLAADRLLILLTGPVGGGKTTVAEALAKTLRKAQRAAAVIDLDVLYCMARQSDGFGDEVVWETARRGAAALANHFFDSGLDAVIIEGSFHNEGERDDVTNHLRHDAHTILVALKVSLNETVRRVEADPAPDRVLSRNPEVLRYLHSEFETALPFLNASGAVIEADSLSPAYLAEAILERILKGEPAI